MIRPISTAVTLVALVIISSGTLAQAKGNDLVIKDGFGEELTIKNGWFGRKHKVVKDRLGNKIEQKNGILGGKETNVNVLGNTFKKKKGWFGGSDIEGTTMLGDKVTTKKGIFGRRTTTVDLSGVSSAIHDLFAEKKPPVPQAPLGNRIANPDPLAPLGDPNNMTSPVPPVGEGQP